MNDLAFLWKKIMPSAFLESVTAFSLWGLSISMLFWVFLVSSVLKLPAKPSVQMLLDETMARLYLDG